MEWLFESQTDFLRYFLQINLLWSIGFAVIYLLSRNAPLRAQYFAHLAIQLYLPLAIFISLILVNNREIIPVTKAVTYTLFSNESAPIQAIANPENESWITSGISVIALFILFFFAHYLYRFLKLFRFVKQEETDLYNFLEQLKKALGLTNKVKIVLTKFFNMPFSFALRHAYIILPAYIFRTFPPGQQEMIIRHELEHIRRGDFFVNLLQKLVRILFIYNPLIHLNDRLIDEKREMLCDAAVLRQKGVNKKTYAETLLAVTEAVYPAAGISPVVPFYHTPSQLKRRMIMIKKKDYLNWENRSYSLLILAVIACFLAITFSAPNAAEPGGNGKYTYATDKYEVILDDEKVEILEDGKRKTYLKGSKEYEHWAWKFGNMEQTPQDKKAELLELERELALKQVKRLENQSAMSRKYLLELFEMQNRVKQLMHKAHVNNNHDLLVEAQMKYEELQEMKNLIRDTDRETFLQVQLRVAQEWINQTLHDSTWKETLSPKSKTTNKELQIKLKKQREELAENIAKMEKMEEELLRKQGALREKEMELWKIENELLPKLEEALIADGYLEKHVEKFSFRLEKKAAFVNGKKVSNSHTKKYRELLKEVTGRDYSGEVFEFTK